MLCCCFLNFIKTTLEEFVIISICNYIKKKIHKKS